MSDVYKENDNFVPEPTAQYGTLDTSATAGAAHSKIEEISPVFAVADKQNAEVAARAVDPDDDGVPASAVILPDSDRSYDDAVDAVKTKAERLKDEDISLLSSNKSPAQKLAEEEGPDAAAEAEQEQKDTGAPSGLDGSGTGTTTADKDDDGKAKAAKKTASSQK